ncbi:MAG: sulfhydrogenase 1 subunit delta [archaeon]
MRSSKKAGADLRPTVLRRGLADLRPTVAIYDLTDCEGCELAFVPIVEKILKNARIVEWRLGQERKIPVEGKIDVSFVEGSPMTPEDRELMIELRERSKTIVSLGACACVGGVPSLADKRVREKFMSLIYSPEYKSKSNVPAEPLDRTIKVDYYLHGCPVLPETVGWFLERILIGRIPDKFGGYPVCLACKARENKCLLLEGKPCLGPVSAGECGAPCPSFGKVCYGCTGRVRGANIPQMKAELVRILGSEALAESHLRIFLKDWKVEERG